MILTSNQIHNKKVCGFGVMTRTKFIHLFLVKSRLYFKQLYLAISFKQILKRQKQLTVKMKPSNVQKQQI